jgi:large subunit ribosomal protein L15
MNLSKIKPAKGSVKTNKRLGRGQGSGWGGTASRGMNGAQSRSGYSRKKGFEGGQMPMQRRLPKVGFNPLNRKEYKGINLSTIQVLADKGITTIDLETMHSAGLTQRNRLVKILGNGELKTKVEVKAHAFSKSAQAAIEAKGGSVVKIESK